jgi:hypothetical protein
MMFQTSASDYIYDGSDLIPINREGFTYLISKIRAMQEDYDALIEEIRELESATAKNKKPKFNAADFYILDKDGDNDNDS